MSIQSVRHQWSAQRAIQRTLASQRVPHAYIFHGPEGVGKETLAREFTKILLCENPSPASYQPDPVDEATSAEKPILGVDSCSQCRSCTLSEAGTHPDLHLIYRQLIKFHDDPEVRKRKGLDLGVDVIRHFVIEAAGKKPALGRCKVFIIREAELMTNAAQNALLKTLEEPPPNTYILLLTRALENMMPTTRSRCQAIGFNLLPASFVADQLRRQHPSTHPDPIHYFAHHEPGSLGLACQMLELGYFDVNQGLCQSLLKLKRTTSLSLAKEISDGAKTQADKIQEQDNELGDTDAARQTLSHLLAMMGTFYRDLLRLKIDSEFIIANIHLRKPLSLLSDRILTENIQQAIDALNQADDQLSLNANTTLVLENLAIELARISPS